MSQWWERNYQQPMVDAAQTLREVNPDMPNYLELCRARGLATRRFDDFKESKRAEWMTKHELKSCGARECFGRLVIAPRHHCSSRCKLSPYGSLQVADWHWFDHHQMFWHPKTKQYVITIQPYGVSLSNFELLEYFWEDQGLRIYISYVDAWHYPGRCPLIIFANRGVFNQ